MSKRQTIKVAIAILVIATFVNTFAYVLSDGGPGWIIGELIVIAALGGISLSIALLNWAIK